MSIYLRKNALPIFIEIIFVVSCFFVPQEYYIYSNLLFYLLLFADFYVKREFSFRKWVKNLKGGKTFWKQVIVTTVFFLIVFGLTTALESFFPNLDTGMIMLKRDTPARLIAFAISTMFLPAITEESFYRKSIISFRSKPALVLSAVFGMLLYAAEHSLKPWGIFLTAIWALLWGDRIFEKCGIRRDEGGDGGKTLEIRGKRRLSSRDGGANYQQS